MTILIGAVCLLVGLVAGFGVAVRGLSDRLEELVAERIAEASRSVRLEVADLRTHVVSDIRESISKEFKVIMDRLGF